MILSSTSSSKLLDAKSSLSYAARTRVVFKGMAQSGLRQAIDFVIPNQLEIGTDRAFMMNEY
jgi:hypothetical protein